MSGPHLKPLMGAVPVAQIAPSDFPAINTALWEGKLAVQTVRKGSRAIQYIVPIIQGAASSTLLPEK